VDRHIRQEHTYSPVSLAYRIVSLFITFEGPDGSGKSTQIRLLADALERSGETVVVTREPGGTRIGNAIRMVLHDRAHTEMSPRAEALLYNAARAQLIDEIITPALQNDEIVLCDRYADSTRLSRLWLWPRPGLAPALDLLCDRRSKTAFDHPFGY
jgi:hypothetical protein